MKRKEQSNIPVIRIHISRRTALRGNFGLLKTKIRKLDLLELLLHASRKDGGSSRIIKGLLLAFILTLGCGGIIRRSSAEDSGHVAGDEAGGDLLFVLGRSGGG